MVNKSNSFNKSVISSHKYNFSYLTSHGKKFPKLYVRKSKINSKGTFSRENIRKGRIVCPLIGIVYIMSKKNEDYFQHSYQISNNLAVNESKFFNHSCSPNVFINKNWVFEAIKDIKKGDEIVIDYGCVDFVNYLFKCGCNSDKCRMKIDGLVPSNKKFQKTTGKYFSPYLKSKFKLK